MIDDPSKKGPLMEILGEADSDSRTTIMERLIHMPDLEVYFRHKDVSPNEELYYFAIKFSENSPLLVEVALTGEPLRIQARNNEKLETIVERDPRGSFHIYRETFPLIEGIKPKEASAEEILKTLLNYVHKKAKTVKLPNRKGLADNFHVLSYDDLKKIFQHIRDVQGNIDIVPDQSPRMALVRATYGCGKGCIFCAYGEKPFKVLSQEEFINGLISEKEWMKSMYGGYINNIDELFLLSSDIIRLEEAYRAGKTSLSAAMAGKLATKHIGSVHKISIFADTKTALRISEDQDGSYELNGKTYSTKFFESLLREGNISRVVVGWETGSNQGTFALGKHETYKEKLLAATLIQDAGLLLKAVVQEGAWGRGFYDDKGRFHGWRSCTNATVKLANEAQPYRLYLSNAFIHNGPAFKNRFKGGIFIPYDDFKRGIETEQRLLERKLRPDYGSSHPMQVEYHYERFIPPPEEKRRFIVTH